MATTTIRVLALDCKVRECAELVGAQESDFSYNLETATEPVSTVPCRVRNCETLTGVPPVSDLEVYNLQDALQYNGTPLTVIPECPEGYYCPPGSVPPEITYPPGTFPVYVPPDDGTPMVLTGEGCESVITAVLGTHPTAAAIAEAVAYIQNQMAQQQARCDIITSLPPGNQLPTPISLGALTQYACLNVAYAGTIQATSTAPAPYTMLISPLPSWITPSQDPDTLFLDGTPTTIGDYSFTAYAVGVGSSGQRNYTISVVGIVTASPLPDATVDSAYAQSIDASSIPGVQAWSVISGALPSWMTLNTSTGGLSGTPPEGSEGTATFTLQVTNGTVTCSKEFQVETVAGAVGCSIFDDIVWDVPSISDGCGGSWVGGSFTCFTVPPPPPIPGQCESATASNIGTLTNPGGEFNCCLSLTVTVQAGVFNISIFDFSTFTTLLDISQVDTPTPGVYSFPFTVLAGAIMQIGVSASSFTEGAPGDCSGGTGSETFSGSFGNCP